jgi:hypothetical protein
MLHNSYYISKISDIGKQGPINQTKGSKPNLKNTLVYVQEAIHSRPEGLELESLTMMEIWREAQYRGQWSEGPVDMAERKASG